jgi:hypothetical protein
MRVFYWLRTLENPNGVLNESMVFSFHAEMVALYKAKGIDLRRVGASMLVVRVGPENGLLYSKPCPHCQGKLEKLGIRVYYSV